MPHPACYKPSVGREHPMTPFLPPLPRGICELVYTFAEIVLLRCWRANGSQRHATLRVPLLSLQPCNKRALPGATPLPVRPPVDEATRLATPERGVVAALAEPVRRA